MSNRNDDSDRGAPPERLPPDDQLPDDLLLDELRTALAEARAVTDRAAVAARAAFTWRTVDAELMALVHDSWLAEETLVRGPATAGAGAAARIVSFEGDGFTLELELAEGTAIGQVVPGRSARITVARADGTVTEAEADDLGFFTIQELGAGSVRFTVEVGGRRCTTPWLTGRA